MRKPIIAMLIISCVGCSTTPKAAAVRYADRRCQQLFELEKDMKDKTDQQTIDQYNLIDAGSGVSKYDYLSDEQYKIMFQLAFQSDKLGCMDAEPSGPWGSM